MSWFIDPKVIEQTLYGDLVKRIDLSKAYPPFRRKVIKLLQTCRCKGHDYFAISLDRDYEEQKKLYQIGRLPGDTRKIVTNARPGRSAHNYGVALDGCKDADVTRNGLQPDWKIEEYRIWAEEARKLGLEAGYYWTSFKEGPHVQLPLKKHGFEWDALITLYNQGKLALVWQELDKHDWDGGICPGCRV